MSKNTYKTGNQYVINNNNSDSNYYPNLNYKENNNYIKIYKPIKKVTFNNKVYVINDESYKKHNKLMNFEGNEDYEKIAEIINEWKNNANFVGGEKKYNYKNTDGNDSGYGCCFII